MEIKQRRDYIKLVEKMYENAHIATSNVFGINPWPLIRIQSSYFFHLLFVGRAVADKAQSLVYKGKVLFPFIDLVKYIITSYELYQAKKSFKNRLRSKVLLVGFQKHKIDLIDKKVNIYTEPFTDYLIELNIPTDTLWIDKTTFDANTTLEYLYNLVRRNTKAKIALKRAFDPDYNKEFKKAFSIAQAIQQFLQSEEFSLADNIALKVQGAILENEVMYQSCVSFLKILSPLKIINYCFYNNAMMALQRAANFLNIPITEYQHSMQSDDHLAYAKWKNSDDYSSFFPSQFWVWSDDDANRLKRNFSDKMFTPSVIIGGNVFLAQQTSNSVPVEGEERSVLITLQGNWIPQFIEDTIEKLKDYKWYFRLHPRYPDDKIKLTAFYQKFPENVEMELSNKLPLYSLFQKVKFNITSSSGTALEAPSFNVTNLIFGQDGYNCFEPYIKSKQFHFIDTAEELENLLVNVQHKTGTETSITSDIVRRGLKKLYNEAVV